jgi:DNA-binding MarR family transcriptional regulator
MENGKETDRLIFRIIYLYKRLTDQWVTKQFIEEESLFNVSYIPYFMNIGSDGISNTDLVYELKVTRQAVSKIIKELEQLGMVYTVKNEIDARTIMIYLTEKGKVLFDILKKDAEKLSKKYKKVLGHRRYENMIDCLIELVDFHETEAN